LHQNEAIEFGFIILDVSLFEASVFYLEDASFHSVIFVTKLNDDVIEVNEVSLFEIGLLFYLFWRVFW